MRKLLILFIDGYRLMISPILGDCCRFYPTCSSYCKEAIHKHGVFRGIFLGCKRLCKCHPYHPGGVDEVP